MPTRPARASFDIAQFEMAARFQNKLPMDYFNDRKTAAPLGAHNDITAAWGTYRCKDGNYVYLMFLGAGVMKRGLKYFGYEFGVDPFPTTQNFAKIGTEGAPSSKPRSRNSATPTMPSEVENILCGMGVPCSRVMTYEMMETQPPLRRTPHHQGVGCR